MRVSGIYNIQTSIEADEVNDILLDTFERWLGFALGNEAIGGKMLKHPSGKYASTINARRAQVRVVDENGRVEYKTTIIGIYIAGSASETASARIIEHGHNAVDLKSQMLRAGGHRVINFRDNPMSPNASFSSLKGALRSATPIRFKRNLARVWAENYEAHGGKFRSMSDKPGSAAWKIPPMPAFAPAKILRDSLPDYLKDAIEIP